MAEKSCSVYILNEDAPLTQGEIQKALEAGKIDDKIRALKSLVIQIIQDDQFQRMVMTVINTLVPIQDESHSLKKILLFYWEVIEKTNPNGVLKDEMILVCNSLRKDLLHPNEYVRGRTLKLLSRIQLRGILEPLQSAIVENVSHKHVYVRRNAVVCLYEIFLNFGDDLISDMDEMMEKFLSAETDLSAKRNGFLLLFHVNQQKALDFLAQLDENLGDILQLAILELFRKVCKQDPNQKAKLLKIVYQFSKSRSPSVQYECANTLFQISPSATSLRIAINIYMQLIVSQTDNNIKLVVLERLEQVMNANPRVFEDKTQELTLILSQQSLDIRRKVLSLIQRLVKNENAPYLAQALQKELQRSQNETDASVLEFRTLILSTLSQFLKFSNVHQNIAQIMIESVITNSKIDLIQGQIANQILIQLVKFEQVRLILITALQNRFQDISNIQIYKAAFFILGEYSENAIESFNQIKKAIGSLPFEITKNEDVQQKNQVKTIILQDGTYGTQAIDKDQIEHTSKLRELLMNNSFISSSLVRCLMRLLSRMEPLNKYASQALMIFCALLRYYKDKCDQETTERIVESIRTLTGSNVRQELDKFKAKIIDYKEEQQVQQKVILKQPDDALVIRQLQQDQTDIDMDDEINIVQALESNSYVQRLSHIVQLTGYSDPIYAEAFVNVHKYDIQFEVLFINRSPKLVQNVQVEFRTQGDSKVLERAPGVTLQPQQSQKVRVSIKFSSNDLGVIFGAIHYENNAGIEQAYLVTKEINIELIDFIQQATCDIDTFRKLWQKYDWENRISINTKIKDANAYVEFIKKTFKLTQIGISEPGEIICVNLYAKTKLDDDFLINISAETLEDRLFGYVRVRSRVKAIAMNLGDKIKQLQQKIEL